MWAWPITAPSHAVTHVGVLHTISMDAPDLGVGGAEKVHAGTDWHRDVGIIAGPKVPVPGSWKG